MGKGGKKKKKKKGKFFRPLTAPKDKGDRLSPGEKKRRRGGFFSSLLSLQHC